MKMITATECAPVTRLNDLPFAPLMSSTPNASAMGVIPFFTRLAGRMQSGYLFHYAFAMVLGIAALITLMTLAGGAH